MSNKPETYYYGQGRIYIAIRDALTGVPGDYVWIGDVSELTIKLTTQQVKHKESYSGQNSLVRSFPVGREGTLELTLHQIDPDNLALAFYGASNTVASGSVTAEAIAALTVGKDVLLANPGASALVLTDSSTTPKTLVEGTNYTYNGAFGRITPIDVTSFTPPFKAAYSYAGRSEVGIFTSGQPSIALRYEGINLAENNAPVIAEYYKVAPQPLQELQHITTGTDVAGMKVAADMLIDTSKPATGPLGQFGKLQQVQAA